MKEGGHPITGRFRPKLAAFVTGLALGVVIFSAVSLPLFYVFSVNADSPLSDQSIKSRGVVIQQQQPAAKPAGGADDDFIEGNYWALIIGINKYPSMDKDKQLEAAKKDAEAVAKLLVERYGFSKEKMVELYDENATRKGIIRAFTSLKRRLTDKDSLFIYYAGHGEYETSAKSKTEKEKVDGMGYWIPSDAELDDPASYIFNSQVRDYLANISARHIYAVVDSCFSGSLMGRSRALGLGAIKELYQEKSRWVLASGGLYPVPDVADKNKNGHSTFAWHFMKILRQNSDPYLLAKDIAEPIAIRVSNEVQGQLPRSAPVAQAGDEGGQFVFKLRKEFLRDQVAGKLTEDSKKELSGLEDQLKQAEEAVKKQQEEFEKKKTAMLARLKELENEKKRQQEDEEKQLASLQKEAEEKAQRETKEREERQKADAERIKKAEEERVAVLKKLEQEKKEREQKSKEAEIARKKLEDEQKAEAEKLAAQKKEAEERARQAEIARKKAEEERKAEEARVAEEKKKAEEKERQRQAELKRQEEERKAEEARLAAEQKKREEEEKARLEEEQKKLAELRKKQAEEKEASRREELKRQEEEARKKEEARREALRKAEEERLAELKRKAEEKEKQRQAELKRQEEERKAEEARLAEMKKQAEEKERQRQAELKRQEEERKAEEARVAEEKKKAEEKERQRQAELKRQEEERLRLEADAKAAKDREEKQLAELKKKQDEEERRVAEERRAAEEKRKAEEKRLAEVKAKADAERKKQEDVAKKAEEERFAREQEEAKKKRAEDERKAEEARKALAAKQKELEEKAAKGAPEGKPGEAVIVEASLRPFQTPKAKELAPMITIPAGEFTMGSKGGDGQPDESPQRTVYLDAYTIDKFEVTVAQYADYLKKSGGEAPDFWERVNQKEDGNRPVVGVDWLDASEYCEYFGKRLPTEAQWEKAARGTDGRKYPWGNDDPGPLFANFASGVAFSYSKSLSAVGSYESGKSPYGVYDMVGNVWEWLLDWYEKTYYQAAPQKNPAGPASGDYKVIRGGSWSKRPAVARVAGRMYSAPSQRSNSVGFRCAGEAK